LMQCYEVASPRVRRYLEAEIHYILSRLGPDDRVLELGCGYGRVALRLVSGRRHVVGIDTAEESLALARELTSPEARCEFMKMNALELTYPAGTFDAIVCAQNGICAFGVDHDSLLREALRCARVGGILLFSTYSDRFWKHRLEWFQAQAAAGLLGPVDLEASGGGTIVCTDGFRAARITTEGWQELCARLGVDCRVAEVDGSSVFCEIVKRA
jgi:ubiquinone/menaquinone biosynthesis C-methylase UbiE